MVNRRGSRTRRYETTIRTRKRRGVNAQPRQFGVPEDRIVALPRAIVRILAEHADLFRLDGAERATLVVGADYVTAHNGVTQLTFTQTDHGRNVFGSSLTFSIGRHGRILSMGGHYYPDLSASGRAALSAADAVARAAADAVVTAAQPLEELSTSAAPDRRTVFANSYARDVVRPAPITAELVTFPVDGTTARLAWQTEIEASPVGRYLSVVDAETGALLYRFNEVLDSSPEGNVFTTQNPTPTAHIIPFTGAAFDAAGWVDSSSRTTSGNNTNTYLDQNGSDSVGYQPQTPASPDPAFQHFDYTFSNAYFTSSCADITTDRDFTVTQLFYWVNFMHDYLYGLGFNEAAHNFQSDNFGRGGSGGDPVLAEGYDNYDGGARNNANFSTGGSDGSTSRLQVFLGAPPFPCLESELEGDTVLHEYSHGLSGRLVGGGNLGGGIQSGGMGEGWSDFMAISIFNDPVIFEYDSGNPTTGLRRVAYNNSPWTYTDLCNQGCEVHNDGEIWATVLWDLRTKLISLGFTSHDVEQLVVDGMKMTIGNPTFLDARNGILSADTADHGGADQCRIWGVFAARKMGFSAASPTQAPPVTPGTDGPASCTPVADSGAYTTNEGSSVSLSATASTENGDGPFTYAWDLDNNGTFETSGKTVTFGSVGQDGVYPVKVKVTNADGFSNTSSTTVTVNNVVPTVTTLSTNSPQHENSAVSATVVVTDPGWLDAPTATIDWGDGTGTTALVGTLVNGFPPDATLSASPAHTYGDNGTFTLTVCPSDEAAGTCSSTTITVTNVNPTAAIDKSGAIVVNGVATFIGHAGSPMSFSAGSTDPGSDDLTLTWNWGDATPNTSTVYLNDPVNFPGGDPFPSPTINPRNVTDTHSHTFGDACVYTVGLGSRDDDGGSASDNVAVIMTGNSGVPRNAGYWQTQYRPRPTAFTEATRLCYLEIVGFMSAVFNEVTDASTVANAFNVLYVGGNKGDALQQLDRQLLTAWLNFANGGFNFGQLVDTNGDGIPDTAFSSVLANAESVRLNPASTPDQLRAQRDLLDRING
jgi:hypothetical protein